MQVSMRYPMMADDRYLYTPSGDCEMQVRFLFVENTPIIEKRSESNHINGATTRDGMVTIICWELTVVDNKKISGGLQYGVLQVIP